MLHSCDVYWVLFIFLVSIVRMEVFFISLKLIELVLHFDYVSGVWVKRNIIEFIKLCDAILHYVRKWVDFVPKFSVRKLLEFTLKKTYIDYQRSFCWRIAPLYIKSFISRVSLKCLHLWFSNGFRRFSVRIISSRVTYHHY